MQVYTQSLEMNDLHTEKQIFIPNLNKYSVFSLIPAWDWEYQYCLNDKASEFMLYLELNIY